MGPKSGTVIKWSNPPPNPTSHWFLKRNNSYGANKNNNPLNQPGRKSSTEQL